MSVRRRQAQQKRVRRLTDHDESSTHSTEETLDTELLGETNESGDGSLSGLSLGLVHAGTGLKDEKEARGRQRLSL